GSRRLSSQTSLFSKGTAVYTLDGTRPDVRRWAAAVAQEVHRRFGTRVVASLGRLGAVVAAESGVAEAVPTPIKSVSTCCSGDALVAGHAVGWTRGWKQREDVRLDVAAPTGRARRFSTGSVTAEETAELFLRVTAVSIG